MAKKSGFRTRMKTKNGRKIINAKRLCRSQGAGRLNEAAGGITDQRSMAGTAPTDFQFTRTLDAGPVHCSVWLSPWQFRRQVL